MRNPDILLTVCLGLGAAALATTAPSAQNFVARGDIVTGAGTRFATMLASGQSSTEYAANPSVGAILWDPTRPDSFLCGAGGSSSTTGILLRKTFDAPGNVRTDVVVPSGTIDTPWFLCWDQDGRHVVSLGGWGRVHRIDTATGDVTPLVSGAQPWSSSASGMAVHPATRDVYVVDNDAAGTLYRIASGSGGVSQVATGLGTVEKLLIDASRSPARLLFLNASRMGRLDLDNLSQPAEFYWGVIGKPNAVANMTTMSFDHRGDVLVADSYTVYRLPNTATIPTEGVVPGRVGSFSFNVSSAWVRDITVVGATTRPYELSVQKQGVLGARIELRNAPARFGYGYLLVSRATLLPVDTGPFFGLLPDGLTLSVLAATPEPGSLFAHLGALPPALTLPNFFMAPFFNETWDLTGVAFGLDGRYLGRTNVERVTWN